MSLAFFQTRLKIEVSLSGDFGTKVILDAEQDESVKVTSRRDFFERNQIWLVTLAKSSLFAVAEQALLTFFIRTHS